MFFQRGISENKSERKDPVFSIKQIIQIIEIPGKGWFTVNNKSKNLFSVPDSSRESKNEITTRITKKIPFNK